MKTLVRAIPICKTAWVILAVVRRRQEAGALPPTYAELRAATAITNASIQRHLKRLRRLGLVTWEVKNGRASRLTLRAVVRYIPVGELATPGAV